MLNALRNSASSWVAKVLIGLLILSFAVWGVSGFLGNVNSTTVATVGETDVSAARFDRSLSIEISRLQRQIRQPVSLSQAVAFGLPNQVLSQLISEAAVEDIATTMNLGVSDQKLQDDIVNNPTFRGPDGQFDRTFLQQILQSNSLTEGEFIADQRSFSKRRQISLAVSGGAKAPDTLLKALHDYQGESRSIRGFQITASDLDEIAEPADAALSSYFEENKATYRAPEYRAVTLINLKSEDLADPDAISDDDAQRIYDEQSARFSVEEKRQVQQLVISDKAEADAVRAKLTEGSSWSEILQERGISESAIDLGLVVKEDLIEEAVADAVFSAQEGSISDVIKGRFGSVIVRVVKIEPASEQAFDDVKAQIKTEIANDEAKDQLYVVRDAVEDSMAGGASVEEAAKANGLTTQTLAAIDSAGLGEDGNAIADLPLRAELLTGIFEGEVGLENPPLEGPDQIVWYEITGVTPDRDRTLDEVKSRVATDWRQGEVAKQLDALADSLAKGLTDSASFEALADARGASIQTINGITRSTQREGLNASNVTAIFELADNGFGYLTPDDANQRFVMELFSKSIPDYSAEDKTVQQIAAAASSAFENELLNQYVAELQENLNVSLNQPLLTQMLTGSQDQYGQ